LNLVDAIVTAWGMHPGPIFLAQQAGMPVAVVAVATAYRVFGGLQVADFDFDVFLLHFSFPFLSRFVVSEESFLAVH
jgi:hypothetical protein